MIVDPRVPSETHVPSAQEPKIPEIFGALKDVPVVAGSKKRLVSVVRPHTRALSRRLTFLGRPPKMKSDLVQPFPTRTSSPEGSEFLMFRSLVRCLFVVTAAACLAGSLALAEDVPQFRVATFQCDVTPTQLALIAVGPDGKAVELVRQAVAPPTFEAAVVARPEKVLHPVDLGTILPPTDWLLLAVGQKGCIDVAAICRNEDMPDACARAWFESTPAEKVEAKLSLARDRVARVQLPLPAPEARGERDVLHVSINTPDGKPLKEERIRTMRVARPPTWPKFGRGRDEAPLRRARFGARRRRGLLDDELRGRLGPQAARRRGGDAQRIAIRLSGEVRATFHFGPGVTTRA